MKVLAIADTHGWLPKIEWLPEVDVLIVAGDLTAVNMPHDPRTQWGWVTKRYCEWLDSVPAKHKLVIAGNHDWVLMEVDYRRFGQVHQNTYYEQTREALGNAGATLLQDSGCEIDGVKFWGTPWTPQFHDWAFMKRDPDLFEYFRLIPKDTNVLISHGPPLGFGDYTVLGGGHQGSATLRRMMGRLPDLTHAFFGHIHNGHGIWEDHGESELAFPNRIVAQMHNVAVQDDHYHLFSPDIFKSKTHYLEIA